VFGVLHRDKYPLGPKPVALLEQCPVADDPFTGPVSAVGKRNRDGTTNKITL
jgi:hypothetical protein